MIVPGQKNIKVHFAACENVNQFNCIMALGGKYSLYTVYPFLERRLFEKSNSPIIPCQYKNDILKIPDFIISNSRHCIQDSGLFTLMFGSQKGEKSKRFIDNWYNALIEFTLKYNTGATVVEVDCQKLLGPAVAWEYRERMKIDLPNHRQINVFHIEDGIKGLDRMIEFSNYIAVSVPELRFAKKKSHIVPLVNYIKNKKPDIDIHLLGCTDISILKQLRFCSSCDSSSYTSGVRYGSIGSNKISSVKIQKAKGLIKLEYWNLITRFIGAPRAAALIVNISHEMNRYKKIGHQG